MASLRKNVAGQHIKFQLNAKADGTPVTAGGAGNVTIDAGAQAACVGTFTHLGTGQWDYAPTQAETNGTNIGFQFTGTGAIAIGYNFYTDNYDTSQPVLTSGTGANQVQVNGSGKVSGVVLTDTATTVTNQLTAAAIATGVWQDTTAGDFTVANSVGKSVFTGVAPGASGGLFIAGTNAATTITGSLTTTFTGNLTGSVASVTAGVTVTTNNDKTGYSLTQAFPANFSLLAIDGSGFMTYNNAAPPSSATIAGAVWDVTLASHVNAGSTGFALNAAGAAGDPWSTSLPGAYAAGTAGYYMGVYVPEMWKLQGLDKTNPLVVSSASRVAGASISQSIASVAGGTTTVARL